MEERRIISDGAVHIQDGVITDVGKASEIARRNRAEIVIDAKWKMILPGFVNAHYHSDVSLARNMGADLTISANLTTLKWPRVMAMTSDDYETSAQLGYAENIRMGVTLVGDNFYARKDVSTDGIGKAAQKIGIRTVMMKGYHDEPSNVPAQFIETPRQLVHSYDNYIRRWKRKRYSKIQPWISPVNLQYNTVESIAKLTELAKKHDVGIHTHASEDTLGVEAVKRRFKKNYIEVFKAQGTLNLKRRFQVAHGVFLTRKEMVMLAHADSTVIHNPMSNLMRRAGIAPVRSMRESGVRVALGTDSKHDIQTALRLAIALQNISHPPLMSLWDVLEMATLRGAEAFQMDKQLGSIKKGKQADIVLVDLKTVYTMPITDPLAALVYYSNGADVDTVIIDGEVIMQDKKILTIDEVKLIEQSQNALENLRDRMKRYLT